MVATFHLARLIVVVNINTQGVLVLDEDKEGNQPQKASYHLT